MQLVLIINCKKKYLIGGNTIVAYSLNYQKLSRCRFKLNCTIKTKVPSVNIMQDLIV